MTVLMKGNIFYAFQKIILETTVCLYKEREFLVTTDSIMSGIDLKVFSTSCSLCFCSSYWLYNEGKIKCAFYVSFPMFYFLFSSSHKTNYSSCPCYWYRQVTCDVLVLSELILLISQCTTHLQAEAVVRVAREKKKVCFVPQKVYFIVCLRYCYKCIFIVIPYGLHA